jgi:1-acyl-sn-glycerol-3-phosphate acyltransferase
MTVATASLSAVTARRATARPSEWSAWRAAFRSACLVALVLDACLVLAVVLLVPISSSRKGLFVQRTTRRFAQRALAVLNVRVTVAGRVPNRPTLLACNHLSWIDILIAHVCFPEAAFVAKSEVATWPVLGSVGRLANTVFVNRARKRDVLQTLPVLRETLAHRHVVLFAEGTTTDGSCTLPFKSSLFESAVSAAVPVVPVAIRIRAPSDSDTRALVCWVGEASLLSHIAMLAGVRAVHVALRIGDAVPTSVPDDVVSVPHAKPSRLRKQIARAAHLTVSRTACERGPLHYAMAAVPKLTEQQLQFLASDRRHDTLVGRENCVSQRTL